MKTLPKPALRALARAAIAVLVATQTSRVCATDLLDAYHLALQADPTSLVATDALTAGREKAVQGDALLRPQVSLQAGLNRIDDRLNAVPAALRPLIAPDSAGTARQVGVQMVQPLYDRAAAANRQQLHQQSALAETRYGAERQDLALRVADAYFGVLLAEETLRVTEAEKNAVRHQRDRAQARFQVGQGKITDVHEAQARLDAVDTNEVAALAMLEIRRARYQETVGGAPDQLAHLATRFVPRPPEPNALAEWQARGERQSYLVKARRTALDIAVAEIDKYRLSARPTLDLTASYTTRGQSGSLSALTAPNGERTGAIGLQLTVPLYAGGAIDSRQREAVAQRSQAEQELAAGRRDVRLQVQEGYLAVATGVTRVAALEQALVSARSALEATTLGRDVGTRTELDVLDAQQRVFGAELNLVQGRVDYLLGRLRLAAAAGELSEASLRELGAWLGS